MKIKKNTIFAALILSIVFVSGYFVFASGNTGIIGKVIATGDVQVIKMHVENANYILEPNIVKKGLPVKIEADITKMPGCSKSVVISAFNIRKTLTAQDNIIEFTPDKAGTFNIACSMNMYRATFTVLESDGTKSNNVEPQTTGGSCGGGGGGCGCGGAR